MKQNYADHYYNQLIQIASGFNTSNEPNDLFEVTQVKQNEYLVRSMRSRDGELKDPIVFNALLNKPVLLREEAKGVVSRYDGHEDFQYTLITRLSAQQGEVVTSIVAMRDSYELLPIMLAFAMKVDIDKTAVSPVDIWPMRAGFTAFVEHLQKDPKLRDWVTPRTLIDILHAMHLGHHGRQPGKRFLRLDDPIYR